MRNIGNYTYLMYVQAYIFDQSLERQFDDFNIQLEIITGDHSNQNKFSLMGPLHND